MSVFWVHLRRVRWWFCKSSTEGKERHNFGVGDGRGCCVILGMLSFHLEALMRICIEKSSCGAEQWTGGWGLSTASPAAFKRLNSKPSLKSSLEISFRCASTNNVEVVMALIYTYLDTTPSFGWEKPSYISCPTTTDSGQSFDVTFAACAVWKSFSSCSITACIRRSTSITARAGVGS